MNRTILKSTGAILAGFITVAVLSIGTYYPNRILLLQVLHVPRLATPYSDSRAAAPPPANSSIQRGSQLGPRARAKASPAAASLSATVAPQQQSHEPGFPGEGVALHSRRYPAHGPGRKRYLLSICSHFLCCCMDILHGSIKTKKFLS